VYRIVRGVAAAAGAGRIHPHAIRHASVTAALDATGGDVRRVQRYSRHANVAVLLRYDDARTDDAGEVARIVAARMGGG
jgi:integrase/recombinase XerC